MNSLEVTAVPIHFAETVVDEIQDVFDQVTHRAYEIFRRRSGAGALDLEDWLTAERELLSKPEVHVEENHHALTITIDVGIVRPVDLRLLLSPDALVIQAEPAPTAKRMFRTIQFPRRIEVTKAEARYENGCLILTA